MFKKKITGVLIGYSFWTIWLVPWDAYLITLKNTKEEESVKIGHDGGPRFRAVIVDRDSMSGDLLASALISNGNFEAIAIQSADLMRTLSANEVDLVVIGAEFNSNAGSGFDLAQSVCDAYPDMGVVILLNQTTHESVINAFQSGARGVFSREQPMNEFLDCVEHVRKGYIWAGRQETKSLLEALRHIPSPNLITARDSPTLTARELQVVQYAAKGKTNKTIANDLGLSEHTVKNYLFRAFEKLGVSSRVELLFYLTLRGHTFGMTAVEEADKKLKID